MGLLQPDVGHRGGNRQSGLTDTSKAVTIHDLRQARAAVAAAAEVGRPVTLLSAPGAAGTVGPAWFVALVEQAHASRPETTITGVLDCGGMPGHALAALRHGLKTICYDGPGFDAIAAIAAAMNAVVARERPPALDLIDVIDDPADLQEACRQWLSAD